MATDLELAVATLQSKQKPYTLAWDYYDGEAPLRYSTAKLNEIFNNIEVRFSENWIAVVVDALAERMELERLDVMQENGDVDQALSDHLNELWTSTEMDGDEEDIETAMLVTGESYAVAWQEDGREIQSHYHDPRNAHVFYEPDNPKQKRFAAKWWQDEDKHMRLTLYYPDRLEYYRSTSKVDDLPGNILSGKSFTPIDTAANPHNMIPVFHWQLTRRRTKSAIVNLVEPQDAINKLLNDMMIAAEFGALPQRYVITNANLGNLKSRPNEIWELPPGDGIGQQTSAGQFEANPLANFIEAMDKLALYVAVESGLPKHYFLSQGGDPSGESLIAAESRLNKRATMITKKRLAPPYRELASFLLFLDGAAVDKNRIVPVFTKPETVQPFTRAQMVQTYTNSGASLEGAADVSGHTEAEIEKLARIATPPDFGENGR